jgi:L-asparagine transporter-like permease
LVAGKASASALTLREAGLNRALSARKLSMIALGGTIGTGLFLGIGFAIGLGGPSTVLSYMLGALIALLLAGCLAEMAVVHPVPGSFGTYAEAYIGPFAGFLVRYAYWTGNVLAIGTEVAAIALYMQRALPGSPGWLWSAAFSGLVIYVNCTGVNVFGTVEYWLSTLKVAVILLFMLIVAGFLLGSSDFPSAAIANYTAYGGFFPKGLWGTWTAVVVAMFSFMGVETVAVAAGEAEDPRESLERALGSTVLRLILFYVLTLALLLATVPWTAMSASSSPFVLAMERLHLPLAAHIVNFAILLAALSAINSQLYIATRMMFSLSRAGLAPVRFGTLNARAVPVNALLISSIGVVVATILSVTAADSAYAVMVAISIFAGVFSWMMIFATHYCFRRKQPCQPAAQSGWRMPGFPVLTLAGLVATAAILATTLFMRPFRLTLIFGIPFLLFLTATYFIRYRKRERSLS